MFHVISGYQMLINIILISMCFFDFTICSGEMAVVLEINQIIVSLFRCMIIKYYYFMFKALYLHLPSYYRNYTTTNRYLFITYLHSKVLTLGIRAIKYIFQNKLTFLLYTHMYDNIIIF